ncbi:hypothetical protein ACHAW5_004897 [Stephanodiscus triporus]|uniref:Uncharacterized protein n=1 Tax=Stephanodiscus triporus TaxID=2934178 RepID=A0ABD3NYQ1_9STRA
MRPPPPPLRRRRPDRRERAALPFASSRWCHLVVCCSSIALFQNRLSALVSGDVINAGGGIAGIADDIIVTDNHDRRNEQISVEIEPEKAKGNSWESDDDDDSVVTAVVDVAGYENGENDVSAVGEDTIEFPAGRQNGKAESVIGASNVADVDEYADAASGVTHVGHVEGESLGQDSAEDETKVTSERPDDGDAKVENSASDALVDTEITLEDNVDPTPGQVSVEGSHDRPDDDDDVADEILSESVKTIISENEIGAGDSQKEVTASKTVLPLDDDDDDVTNIVGGSKEIDDLGVPSPTDIDGSEDSLALSSLHSQPTAFHRSQSSEGDAVVEGEGALVEDEKVKVEVPEKDATGPEKAGESTQEAVRNDTGAENGNDRSVPDDLSAANVGNGGSDLSILTEDNANIALEDKPSEEMLPGSERTQQPPIQDWDDEDEDSLFEMLQSTFNVILLAVGLTSFLVFRKRVKDRVLADPSIHVTSAIKDEIIDVAIRLVSWATGTSNGAKTNISNAEVGNDTSTGFGNETIPLSTATDEEWGWEDEDMGNRLELSAIGGDEAKEDDDLAMAIAMSISDSRNSSDEAMGTTASVLKPINPSNMNGSRYSPSTGNDKTQRSSTTAKFSSTSFETQSYSAGGDSIADLLGQMGSNGGPVITSFGQKPSTITKPKSQPKNESADDIFASMGLSTSYSSTTASRPSRPAPKSVGWQASTSTQSKKNAPKSTQLSSLLDDTFDGDVDADTWGDCGDLDDLLD